MAAIPRGRYVPSRSGMQRFLTSQGLAAVVEAKAQKGLTHARAIAPRQSGRYVDSLKLVRQTVNGRVIVGIVSTDPKGGVIEWRDRVLGRSADRVK